jgi:hypothetical protein
LLRCWDSDPAEHLNRRTGHVLSQPAVIPTAHSVATTTAPLIVQAISGQSGLAS